VDILPKPFQQRHTWSEIDKNKNLSLPFYILRGWVSQLVPPIFNSNTSWWGNFSLFDLFSLCQTSSYKKTWSLPLFAVGFPNEKPCIKTRVSFGGSVFVKDLGFTPFSSRKTWRALRYFWRIIRLPPRYTTIRLTTSLCYTLPWLWIPIDRPVRAECFSLCGCAIS